ncbi:hypothetical protein PG997_010856 [Apiospora hydei]|uniref:Uncharacterized protein n=1 Tax=Apiospora hydei TaxID=1337664 RepID=A0ABR1VLC0_9PEZI
MSSSAANENPNAGNERRPPETNQPVVDDSAAPASEGSYAVTIEDNNTDNDNDNNNDDDDNNDNNDDGLLKISKFAEEFHKLQGFAFPESESEEWTLFDGIPDPILDDIRKVLSKRVEADLNNFRTVSNVATAKKGADPVPNQNIAYAKENTERVVERHIDEMILGFIDVWKEYRNEDGTFKDPRVYGMKTRDVMTKAMDGFKGSTEEVTKMAKAVEKSHNTNTKKWRNKYLVKVAYYITIGGAGMAAYYFGLFDKLPGSHGSVQNPVTGAILPGGVTGIAPGIVPGGVPGGDPAKGRQDELSAQQASPDTSTIRPSSSGAGPSQVNMSSDTYLEQQNFSNSQSGHVQMQDGRSTDDWHDGHHYQGSQRHWEYQQHTGPDISWQEHQPHVDGHQPAHHPEIQTSSGYAYQPHMRTSREDRNKSRLTAGFTAAGLVGEPVLGEAIAAGYASDRNDDDMIGED